MDSQKRQCQMTHLRREGLSCAQIGKLFGVSRQRVHQNTSGYQRLNHSGRHKNGWYAVLKSQVYERDHHTCQHCSSTESLIVHHIDNDDNNNEVGNLLTLCKSCHLVLHAPQNGMEKSNKGKQMKIKNSKMVTVRLPEELVQAIDKEAEERGLNRSIVAREWLETGATFGEPLAEWAKRLQAV